MATTIYTPPGRRLFYISLCCLIAISIAVNLFTVLDQSIRLDESQSLWAATKSISEILNLTSQDVHVPLYNILLHFWIQFFGTNITVDRGLSFIFFILTIPVLYKVYRQVSGRSVSLLGVTIFSLSPFILWYSSEARMYTMFALATCLNHLFFLILYKSEGRKGRLGYFLSTLFGLYSHYFFIFFLFTQFFYVVLRTLQDHPKTGNLFYKIRAHWIFLKQYISILLLSGIFFSPWAMYFIMAGTAVDTQPLIPEPTSYNIFVTFINFFFGFQSEQIQSAMVSLWPLIVLLLFFVFTKRRALHIQYRGYFLLTAFFPIFFIFLISLYKPIFLTRYLIFVTPSLFFIISWMLMSYAKRTSTILISGFLGLLLGLLLYQNLSSATPVKENYLGVATYLEAHTNGSDVIAVSAPFTIYPVAYTYVGEASIVTIPQWDMYSQGAIPPFTIKNLQQQIKIYSQEYNRVYIVLSYDQGYEKKIQVYMDTHYQRLTKKIFSPGLEVDVYQLRYDTLLQK